MRGWGRYLKVTLQTLALENFRSFTDPGVRTNNWCEQKLLVNFSSTFLNTAVTKNP